MDRIALAKRLESLSSVFASHTPYNRDLKAMSYVLNKMADDKFKNIMSADFASDEAVESCMCGGAPEIAPEMPGAIPMGGPLDIGAKPKVIVIKTEEAGPMSVEATEKTAGMFWSKDASKAVIDNLLRDVVGMNKSICCDTGRHLDKEQVPDGTHAGLPQRAQTLTEEQTPDVAKVLDSGIVDKSHGKVEKEASIADIKKKKEEDKKKKALKVLEGKKTKDSSEAVEPVVIEAANKSEEEKKEKETACDKDATSSLVEGIELMASMDDVELDAKEAAELSKLFE
jgi:hypothetical protein